MKIPCPVVIGLTGMSACLIALLIDMIALISGTGHALVAQAAIALGCKGLVVVGSSVKNEVDVLRQLLLLFGAAFLFLAALSRGPSGRLFQILEGALVIYGIFSFIPMPKAIAVVSRLLVSASMFFMLYRLGLLKGTMNKIGAGGLEFLGMGYLFGSHECFLVGGVLLTIFCADGYMKEPSLLNGLWTALNGPFAMASVTVIVFRLAPELLPSDRAWLAVNLIAVLGGFVPFALIAHEKSLRLLEENPGEYELVGMFPGHPPIVRKKLK